MIRIVMIFMAAFLVAATSLTFAKSENSGPGNNSTSHGSSEVSESSHGNGNINPKSEVEDEVENEGSESGRPVASCAPETQWKNHGEYVSCIAKLHQGGQAVSEAARSDIGKKHASPSGSFKPSPTASSSASASLEPSPSASEEANLAEALENIEVAKQFEAIGQLVQDFLHNLRNLFTH